MARAITPQWGYKEGIYNSWCAAAIHQIELHLKFSDYTYSKGFNLISDTDLWYFNARQLPNSSPSKPIHRVSTDLESQLPAIKNLRGRVKDLWHTPTKYKTCWRSNQNHPNTNQLLLLPRYQNPCIGTEITSWIYTRGHRWYLKTQLYSILKRHVLFKHTINNVWHSEECTELTQPVMCTPFS